MRVYVFFFGLICVVAYNIHAYSDFEQGGQPLNEVRHPEGKNLEHHIVKRSFCKNNKECNDFCTKFLFYKKGVCHLICFCS
ncbi:unnamed protein product, partial [Brenthis ino]